MVVGGAVVDAAGVNARLLAGSPAGLAVVITVAIGSILLLAAALLLCASRRRRNNHPAPENDEARHKGSIASATSEFIAPTFMDRSYSAKTDTAEESRGSLGNGSVEETSFPNTSSNEDGPTETQKMDKSPATVATIPHIHVSSTDDDTADTVDGGRASHADEKNDRDASEDGEFYVDEEGYRVRKTPASAREADRKRRDSFYSSSDEDSDDGDDGDFASDSKREAFQMKSLKKIKIRARDDAISSGTMDDVHKGIQEISTMGNPHSEGSRSRSATERSNDFFATELVSPITFGEEDPFMASVRVSKPNGPGSSALNNTASEGLFDDSDFGTPTANHVNEASSSIVASAHDPFDTVQHGQPTATTAKAITEAFVDTRNGDPFAVAVKESVSFRNENGAALHQPKRTVPETNTGLHSNTDAQKESFVDIDALKPVEITPPKADLSVSVLVKARDTLRNRKIRLWLLPYTDEHGNGHINEDFVAEIASDIQEEFSTTEAAIERLRKVTFNKKIRKLKKSQQR